MERKLSMWHPFQLVIIEPDGSERRIERVRYITRSNAEYAGKKIARQRRGRRYRVEDLREQV